MRFLGKRFVYLLFFLFLCSDLRDSRVFRRSFKLGLHSEKYVLRREMDGIMKRLEVDRRKTSGDEEFN